MGEVIHVDFKRKNEQETKPYYKDSLASLGAVLLTLLALAVLYSLSGCTSVNYPKMLDIAQKSYRIGCIDRSNGKITDTYTCYQKSKKFKKELDKAWRKNL